MGDCSRLSLGRPSVVQRLLLLLLLGGLLILLLEIRFEHQAVLGETWRAWIPLGYLSLMCVIIPIGVFTIDRFGSKLLAVAFSGLMIVGSLGFWFHGKDKLSQRIETIISTIVSQPGRLLETNDQDTTAPLLAPLSLVGLGAMGFLISMMRCREAGSTGIRTEAKTDDKDNL